MSPTDLYGDLGVPGDADAAAIKAAYRGLSKHAHPDTGGSPEAFNKLKHAYAVLSDPERRKRYDQTGIADEVRPDNDEAMAREALCQIFGKIVDTLQDRCFETDVISAVEKALEQNVSQATAALSQCQATITAQKKLRTKIKRKRRKARLGVLEGLMDQRVQKLEKQIESIKHSIKVCTRALELARCYEFEFDTPVQTFRIASGSSFFGTSTSGVNW